MKNNNDNVSLISSDFRLEMNPKQLDTIGNMEKGISETEFKTTYVDSGKFDIYTEKQVVEFAKALNNDIEKGVDGVGDKKFDVTKLQRVTVEGENSIYGCFVNPKIEKAEGAEGTDGAEGAGDDINKSEVEDDDINKSDDDDGSSDDDDDDELSKTADGDIEKSVFSYSSKVTIEKTGKEVKEKLESCKTKLEAKKTTLKSEMNTLQEKVGFAPDEDMYNWAYRGKKDKVGEVKRYKWEKCYYNDNTDNMTHGAYNGVDSEGANSKEQAKSCREYNDKAEEWIEVSVDILECEFFIKNLDDKKKYTLSPDEAMKLDF